MTSLELSPAERASLDELAVLSPAEYDRMRPVAAEKLGINKTALDKEIKLRQKMGEKESVPLGLEDPEPWPNPVDGTGLLDDLTDWIRGYVDMPVHAAHAVALWTVSTWFVDGLYFAPILVILGPTKRVGKSTLLDLLRHVVRRGLRTSGPGVTPAVLFRLNESRRPTILIDEGQKLRRDARDLIELLNEGYRRGGWVVRCEEKAGGGYTPVVFDAFGYRAVAAIGVLADTIMDRAIDIRLQRAPKNAGLRRFNGRVAEREGQKLARQIARFAADHSEAAAAIEEHIPRPPWLNDRACDNWGPLFTIASVVNGSWETRALEAARVLAAGIGNEDGDTRIQLLADLREIFGTRGADRLPSGVLIKELCNREERPWSDWRAGKPLTQRQLAGLLRPFGVHPTKIRFSAGTARGYRLADLEDAFRRYSDPPEVEPPEQCGIDVEKSDFPERNTAPDVPLAELGESPADKRDVPLVPLGGPYPKEVIL